MDGKRRLKADKKLLPNGSLVLIGGNDEFITVPGGQAYQVEESFLKVLRCFLLLTDADIPLIEVITAKGSKDPVGIYWRLSKALEKIHSCRVNHIHQLRNEKFCLKEIRDRIKAANAVFFADGDPSSIRSTFADTELIDLIKQRYTHEKLVVAGFDSGAMALSSKMFSSGRQVKDADVDVDIADGLSLLSNLSADTFFSPVGRLQRLVWLMALDPASTVFSICKNTAVIVRGTEVIPIGSGIVMISRGSKKRDSKKLIFTKGLDLKVLVNGARYKIYQDKQIDL